MMRGMRYNRTFARRSRPGLGTPPGSLSTGNADQPTRVEVITFSRDAIDEHSITISPGDEVPDLPPAGSGTVRWINVIGVHDGSVIRHLGEGHGMHELLMEDVQHTDQRPKIQFDDGRLFATLRMVSIDPSQPDVAFEQVSLFAGTGTLITFQEREGDVFSGVRRRIRDGRGRVRSRDTDYLAYVLVDAILDATFPVVDRLQERIEDAEASVLSMAEPDLVPELHDLRGQIVALRRAVRPLREIFQELVRGDDTFFSPATRPFLTDGNDHVLALIDLIDTSADRVTGLFQLYATMLSSSTNDVMRVLTIIATIFIPLTFVAGIYGMNFARMPELQWPWGYPVVLTVMGVIAFGMVRYFRRRKWL